MTVSEERYFAVVSDSSPYISLMMLLSDSQMMNLLLFLFHNISELQRLQEEELCVQMEIYGKYS